MSSFIQKTKNSQCRKFFNKWVENINKNRQYGYFNGIKNLNEENLIFYVSIKRDFKILTRYIKTLTLLFILNQSNLKIFKFLNFSNLKKKENPLTRTFRWVCPSTFMTCDEFQLTYTLKRFFNFSSCWYTRSLG